MEIAGLGQAGHSLKVAVWTLRQLQQCRGEVEQQDGTGLLFLLWGRWDSGICELRKYGEVHKWSTLGGQRGIAE